MSMRTTPHEVGVASDAVGYTAVRMDLTLDEAALLARVGERIASASHGERSLTVAALPTERNER
jgi:hypothetical protein